jgi:hypothetical protein
MTESSAHREESNDAMDYLNDDLQGNEMGDTNKEFGSALKRNASFLLRYFLEISM